MKLGHTLMLLEKAHYPFAHYPKEPCDTLIFPGCSFPAQFPRTMAALTQLANSHGVSVAHDCCGKPLAEAGKKSSAAKVALRMENRLMQRAVKEIVCICPNCQGYLAQTLSTPVISIYSLLARWGLVSRAPSLEGVLFRPCPDKKDGQILAEIQALLAMDRLEILNRIPCCGLRGDIAAHGSHAGQQLCEQVRKAANGGTIYTYCAACSGQFVRHGCGAVRHLLSALLGIEESPDRAHALINRAQHKFIG